MKAVLNPFGDKHYRALPDWLIFYGDTNRAIAADNVVHFIFPEVRLRVGAAFGEQYRPRFNDSLRKNSLYAARDQS
jgi:hypothetical protein